MELLKLKNEFQLMNNATEHIEGGFNTEASALLVKQIAELHDKKIKDINQVIHDNKEHFKNYREVVDLKSKPDFLETLIDNDILNKDYVNSEDNIYLVSERGYLKLLMRFDDEFSWEMYEHLISKMLYTMDGSPNDFMPDSM